MTNLKSLRVEEFPYPHLRDDEGCVLAGDFINREKIRFLIEAVKEKLERDHAQ